MNISRKGLAPIVLFVYNRPEHTLKTLEALLNNKLASDSILYIFADGPKEEATNDEINKIEETRKVLNQKQWCNEVVIYESIENKGLANSIIDGVTKIVNEYGKIIVLEDDILTSPGFLKYMNDALDFYENEEKVMHISAYMFPVKEKLPQTFFYNTASCWGWGTWSRAWKSFNPDSKSLINHIYREQAIYHFNLNESYPFFQHLIDNATGKIDSWAVRWYASIYLMKGLCLHPYPSLTNNLGNDGSGRHSDSIDIFNWSELAHHIKVEKISLIESILARNAMIKFHFKNGFNSKKKVYIDNIKKRVPHFVKNIYLRISNNKSFHKRKEIERIKGIPRYVKTTTNIFGSPFKIIDSASFLFMYDEIFKKEIYKFQTFNKNPVIIDCGANIGLSVLYFKNEFPDSFITSFEPDPEICEILEENIQKAKLSHVKIHNLGLSSIEGEFDFFAEGADAGRIIENRKNSTKKIRTTLLSKYLMNEVDFLKIDIEGSELEVLKEIRPKLHLIKNIFIEFHSFCYKKQQLSELIKIIENEGFRYYIDSPGMKSPKPFLKVNCENDMDFQLNIYAFRK